jgi:hypothetical protein
MAYLDTSVLAAYYCPEGLSEVVGKRLAADRQPTISPLVEVEFCSALAAKVRARELPERPAGRILSLFQKHLADGLYGRVTLDAAQYALACKWLTAFSIPLRAPDALHLAAAFSNDLVLLTADQGLARASRHFDVQCEFVA